MKHVFQIYRVLAACLQSGTVQFRSEWSCLGLLLCLLARVRVHPVCQTLIRKYLKIPQTSNPDYYFLTAQLWVRKKLLLQKEELKYLLCCQWWKMEFEIHRRIGAAAEMWNLFWCTAERSESEDKDLSLPLHPCPHLWSWALGADELLRLRIKAPKISFFQEGLGSPMRKEVRFRHPGGIHNRSAEEVWTSGNDTQTPSQWGFKDVFNQEGAPQETYSTGEMRSLQVWRTIWYPPVGGGRQRSAETAVPVTWTLANGTDWKDGCRITTLFKKTPKSAQGRET